MRYLVTLSYIDPGPLLAAQQVSGLIKGESSPTLEALAGLESEGKIRGGITAGARGARSSWTPSPTRRSTGS